MQHRWARAIIEQIATEDGFGTRSLALLQVGFLADWAPIAPYADRLFTVARSLPAPTSLTASTYTASSIMPGELDGFYHRFGTVLIDRSQRPALHLEWLYLLGQLWNHARRDERQRLFVRWLDCIHGTTAPTDSFITRDHLRGWQRNQMTAHDDNDPTPDALGGMLSEERPENAYVILAQYLGFNTRIDELSRSLRILVQSAGLHVLDTDGALLQHGIAAACCERMVPEAPPDLLITMLSLLAHGIWYTCRSTTVHLPAPSQPIADPHLTAAILAGDSITAQAQARLTCADHDRFWYAITACLDHLLISGGSAWLRAQQALVSMRLTTDGEDPTPETAAVLCGQLAAACHSVCR